VNTYTVKVSTYEGPFELLLQAIKEGRIDIYEVSLAKITHEYLEYLSRLPALSLDNASQFLLMVAYLLEMKSKKLLPQPHVPEEIAEEEEIEQELARHIQEYNMYKDLAHGLRHRKDKIARIYSRYHFNERSGAERIIKLKDVNLADLVSAFQKVWEQFQAEGEVQAIVEEPLTLPQRIEEIKTLLKQARGRIHFEELFIRRTRVEIVVTFLAILELARQKLIGLLQGEKYGEIYLSLSES
jgi:segregation and condensation protein A